MRSFQFGPSIATSMALAVGSVVWASGCCQSVDQPPPAPVNWSSLEARPAPDAGTGRVTDLERALPALYASGLAARGFAGLDSLFGDDAHLASPGMRDAQGRDAVLRAHAVLFGAFDDRHVAVSRVWRTANEQTVEWTLTGTQNGEWLGVPASRRPVAFKGLSLLWTSDDGRINDAHVYIDVGVIKAALGAGPAQLADLPLPAPPSGPPDVFEQGSGDGNIAAATVSHALDALENNRASDYADSVTGDVEIWTLDRPQPARGRAAAQGYFTAMHQAIGQLDTTVDNAWSVGPYAVVEYSISGLQLGSVGWIRAQSDRVLALKMVDVCEVRDGKIARVWRYDNPAQIEAEGP